MVDNERAGSPQGMTSIFRSHFERKLTSNFPLLARGAACSACYLVSSQLEGSRLAQWKFLLDRWPRLQRWTISKLAALESCFSALRPGAYELNHFQYILGWPQPTQLDLHIKVLLVFFDWLVPQHSALWDALNPVGTWLRLMTEQQRDKWNTSSLQEWFSPCTSCRCRWKGDTAEICRSEPQDPQLKTNYVTIMKMKKTLVLYHIISSLHENLISLLGCTGKNKYSSIFVIGSLWIWR